MSSPFVEPPALEELVTLLSDGRRVVVRGAVGVGKSRLVAEALTVLTGQLGPALHLPHREEGWTRTLPANGVVVIEDAEPQELASLAGSGQQWIATTRSRAALPFDSDAHQVFTLDLTPLGRPLDATLWRLSVGGPSPQRMPLSLVESRILEHLAGVPAVIQEISALHTLMDLDAVLDAIEDVSKPYPAFGWRTRIDRLWSSLTPDTKEALRVLVLFAGHFDVDDAQTLLESSLGQPQNALQRLGQLAALNLLQHSGAKLSIAPPLRAHLLRAYGSTKETKERYAALLDTWISQKRTGRAQDFLTASAFAVETAQQHRLLMAADPAELDRASAAELEARLQTLPRTIETDLRRAGLLRHATRFDEALTLLQRVRIKSDGQKRLAASAELGALLVDRGELSHALKTLDDCVSELHGEESSVLYATALVRRSEVLRDLGKLDRALEDAERAYWIFVDQDDVARTAGTMLNLVVLRLCAGRLEAAAKAAKESRDIASREGLDYLHAFASLTLAMCAHGAGELEQACRLYEDVGPPLAQYGTPREQGLTAILWALCLHERGHLDEASLQARRGIEWIERADFGRYAQIARATGLGIEADRQNLLAATEHRRWLAQNPSSIPTIGLFVALRQSHLTEGVLSPELALQVSTAGSFEAMLAARIRKSSRPPVVALLVSRDGRTLVTPKGPLSLRRRGTLRRLVSGLGIVRAERPGHALTLNELFALGWPGENIGFEHVTNRVYNAVCELRRLGLRDILIRRDDGYLLDPNVSFRLTD